MINIEQTS